MKILNWLCGAFAFSCAKNGEFKPKSRGVLMPPGNYYIRETKSHWGNGGICTTYVAYRVEPDGEDWQLGAFKSLIRAVGHCWDNYYFIKRINRMIERNLPVDSIRGTML